ncbi:UPF0605 protein CG18335-like isoform X2 [Sceloporus undulatus]|uniref:UPF0605 protein CG18335-like isoform X2 n=1 Tax=Sceloporus undulatus TaxID=8520 RepID=UPI001C4D7F38|nr:UPF0605 protein CG18335-like isoform X2 [Sceloporus undulatus]
MLSYTPIYIPGYTGFIPKLESIVGETYGNAIRKLLAHQAELLQLSHTEADTLGRRYLLSRMCRQPHGQHLPEDRYNTYECLPTKAHRRLIYDGDPSSTSAVQAIKKAKGDLKPPAKSSKARELTPVQPKDETAVISSLASLHLPADKNIFKKISDSTMPEADQVQKSDETWALARKKRDTVPKKQSRLIYQSNWVPVPNYTGYIPGHKFSFGKTWGTSTRKSLERQKKLL